MIISNDKYLMTETVNSQYSVQMRLVISHIQKPDLGGYKCISKNSIGDAEGNIRLYGKEIQRPHTYYTYTNTRREILPREFSFVLICGPETMKTLMRPSLPLVTP